MGYIEHVKLGQSAFLDALSSAHSVLLSGAGGGFDVFAALPLAFSLAESGKQVHFANLTFSDLRFLTDRPIHSALVEVGHESSGSESYFPEKFLSRWFRTQDQDRSVFCFEKTGVIPLTDAYARLAEHLEVDAVVLVDGGTDILMRGDEAGLGTPAEDMSSLAAVQALNVPTKLVACLGFGVDTYHGVCHAHFLENVAALQREGAYLGALSVLPQMPEAQRYLEALDWVHKHAPDRPSIVNASIASAIEGDFGDVHRVARTMGSELFINPLMSQYFCFELDAVARRVLYLDELRNTQTIYEIAAVLESYRSRRNAKPWQKIPV